MLQQLECFNAFTLKPSKAAAFVSEIRRRYSQHLPFHNFCHGLHVAQATYKLLQTTATTLKHSAIETLSLMIAALGHDVDHSGVNNNFLILTDHPLALIYNDTSPLEHHHCAITCMILRNPASAMLDQFTAEEQRRARSVIVKSILATDMVNHFDDTKWLQKLKKSDASLTDPENRKRLQHTLVHAADLSAQTLSWPLAQRWGQLVQEEFATQSQRERELGLPLTPLMKHLDRPGALAKLQIGFCEFVLQPFWQALALLFQPLQPRVTALLDNCARYKAEAHTFKKRCRVRSGSSSSTASTSSSGSSTAVDEHSDEE